MRVRTAAVLLLLAAAGLLGLGALWIRRLQACGPYARALALAQADPRVRAVLGEPVAADWYVLGSAEEARADLSIPLRGPRRSGKLLVRASRRGADWVLEDLALVTMDGPTEPRTLGLLP